MATQAYGAEHGAEHGAEKAALPELEGAVAEALRGTRFYSARLRLLQQMAERHAALVREGRVTAHSEAEMLGCCALLVLQRAPAAFVLRHFTFPTSGTWYCELDADLRDSRHWLEI